MTPLSLKRSKSELVFTLLMMMRILVHSLLTRATTKFSTCSMQIAIKIYFGLFNNLNNLESLGNT